MPATPDRRLVIAVPRSAVRPTGLRPLLPRLAAVLLGLGLVAGCAQGSGYRYVTNKQVGAFVKVPESWKEYDQRTLLSALEQASSAPQSPQGAAVENGIQWTRGYDSDTTPSVVHLFPGQAAAPTARVTVRALLPEERRDLSLHTLRTLELSGTTVLDVDDALKKQQDNIGKDPVGARTNPQFTLSQDEELTPKGFRGVHLRYTVLAGDGTFHTFDQTSFVDGGTKLRYDLLLACEASCFLQSGKQLDAVRKSFTVRPPKV